MALLTSTVLAIGALVVGGASYYAAEQSRKEAKVQYRQQAEAQQSAREEQQAAQAQASNAERRQQVREERIKRARIIQASENSGTSDSSGLFGAVGGMATQLGANLGTALGQQASANRISSLGQTAANFGSAAQASLFDAQRSDNVFGLSMNIFNAAGGFSAFKTAAPAKTA